MRFINTKNHGIIDYAMGVFMIIVPWLFGFAAGGPATWIFVILGIATIVYSLMTDYEYGAMPLIPMPVHLGADMAAGALLLLSPWLFGFAEYVAWPHVVIGAVEIFAAIATQRVPSKSRRHAKSPAATRRPAR